MRCTTCGVNVSLPTHTVIEVDTLKKEYLCRNGHKNIYKRYGHTVEINGKKTQTNELFDITKANRQAATKRRNRDLLQTLTLNKKN